MYLWSLLLLVIALGFCLIAIAEAFTHQQLGWVCWFTAMAVCCVGFYFKVVAWWVVWMRRDD